jgi:signal transduction histidine kinase
MEEVLLLGSLDAGKMEFKPELLDLRAFVRRLVEEVLSATSRRCPIELFLVERPIEIQADARLLRHIFTNLLTNAVKYSYAGGPCGSKSRVAGQKLIASSATGASAFRKLTESSSSAPSIVGKTWLIAPAQVSAWWS